jgi:hypothetical protein
LPEERVPLSFPQQRLWFMDELNRGAPTYNAALPMRIRGPLDVDALTHALVAVISRHEALRTVFVLDAEGPVQKVLEDWQLDLPLVDLRDVPDDEREGEAQRLLRERTRRPFDLASDLMLRATLLRLADEEWILNVEEHHIAFDGWSDEIMFGELEELYAARLEGREANLPELPIQYGDFTLWQRRRMDGELLAEQLGYWRRQLAGAPSALRLRSDFPRPEVQTYEGAHLDFELSSDLADGVRELARTESATPYMTLLAAFVTLLYRRTGQDDVLVGTPMANRGRLELEQLIGFFSNTVVMRARLGGNPTFRELVHRIREVALGAYAHQECPFEKVVDAVGAARDASLNPLFQVNFRAQSGEPTTLRLSGLEIEALKIDVGFSRFDLALELQLRENAIRGYLEYNVDLFRPETAERIVDELGQLLADVVAGPDTPLLAFELRSTGPANANGRAPTLSKNTGPRIRPRMRTTMSTNNARE